MNQNIESKKLDKYSKRPDVTIDGKTWGDIHTSFAKELSSTAPHKHLGDKTPRFTKPHGKYLYARLKAVQNHCEEQYDNLKTVWLSLTAKEKIEEKWVHPLRHDDGFRSNSVRQTLYRIRNQRLDIKNWAGMWLMSPRKTGYSHKHYSLWLDLDGHYDNDTITETFHSVIDSHIRSHHTATSDGNPYDKCVQVREGDESKGLCAEVARNFPEIGPGEEVPSPDVRDIKDGWKYASIWCAFYHYDNRIRKCELGDFKPIADSSKPEIEWEFGKGAV